ncbi:P-loop NTPase [Akkermansia sp.]|uniref:Mrp/NBP35 family ATP-binding protein n=1 Tax=Akkermansia sp. TaxID=1872421 RepID=UPI003991E44A
MTTQQELTPELIRAALTTVKFPGFSRDIVSFGLVKKIDIDAENNVTIDLVIESKNADIPRYIFEGVHGVMKHLPGVKHCDVNIEHKAPEAKKGVNDDPSTWKSSVPGAKHVIAVASGKGGVGKSTVSANLAVALSKLGYSVGLVDLDIYGPSMSLMFGTKERPGANENDEFLPVTAHGVKLLSMGLLINESDPVAVRGPGDALRSVPAQRGLGSVDFLILDLPPGTGDIQLTIVQTAELDGVVVVTTPQEVALIDARKAIGLFERVKTPILGVIENMSYFQCPSDGKMYHIFGEGGGEREAAKLGVPLLGKIPLDIATRSGGDEGRPVALEDPEQNPVSAAFRQVAEQCARVVLDR